MLGKKKEKHQVSYIEEGRWGGGSCGEFWYIYIISSLSYTLYYIYIYECEDVMMVCVWMFFLFGSVIYKYVFVHSTAHKTWMRIFGKG